MPADSGVWLALADAILVVHAAYVAFVLGGQILILFGWMLGWNWTRHLAFRLAHLIAIGFVMIEAWLGATCPLTSLENILRRRAHAGGYDRSFIGFWLDRLIFYSAPDWVFIIIYTGFTALVILTWLAYPPRRHLR